MKKTLDNPDNYFNVLRDKLETSETSRQASPVGAMPATREYFAENKREIEQRHGIRLQLDQPGEALNMLLRCKL